MQEIYNAIIAANELDKQGDLSNAMNAHMHSVELMLQRLKLATGSERTMLLTRAHEYLSRAERLKNAMQQHNIPTERFHHVKGCDEAKAKLREALLFPKWFPNIAFPKRWQTLLLYGPPGTGKTQLAKAAAGEAGEQLQVVSAADIVSKWQGESEKNVRTLFDAPRKHKQPTIIFIDEIDALCGQRADDENEATRRIKTEFMTQLNEIPPNVTLLAATNTPWQLDSAIMRRFQQKIFVGMPEMDVRRAIIVDLLQGIPHELSEEDIEALANLTEGLTGSDIVVMMNDAMMAPLRNLRVDAEGNPMTASCEACPMGEGTCDVCGSLPISRSSVLKSVPHVKPTHFTIPPPTVDPAQLARY